MLLKRKGDLEISAIAKTDADDSDSQTPMRATAVPAASASAQIPPRTASPAAVPSRPAIQQAPQQQEPAPVSARIPSKEDSRLSSMREAPHSIEDGEEFSPTNWLNEIFMEAMRLDASDIHISPEKDYTSVRFRVGGMINEVARWDIDYHDMVLSRIKIISGLQVVERNIPQDGHLELMFEVAKTGIGGELAKSNSLNFRVSTMPTINGEAAVLRVLNKEGSVLSLSEVGFSEKSLPIMKKILQRGHGVILMTGHSGSGKTTTLYAAMNEINASEKAIITLEDPVEYRVPSVRQSQVNPMVGYDFGNGLRAILRQDPDVIMIGEIRDEETAGIALRLALVGRLVLTTLHTSSILGALTRMVDMDIAKSIVASAFTGIVAERLVRKICDRCRIESVPPVELMKMFDIAWPEGDKVYAGQGCEQCGGTGYNGRIGVFEVLEVDDTFRSMIVQGVPMTLLDDYIKSHVVETLREDGFDKVRKGITTLDEVIRATV